MHFSESTEVATQAFRTSFRIHKAEETEINKKSHLRESRKWQSWKDAFMWLSCHITVKDELDCIGSLFFF